MKNEGVFFWGTSKGRKVLDLQGFTQSPPDIPTLLPGKSNPVFSPGFESIQSRLA